jgi:hypothetical protein
LVVRHNLLLNQSSCVFPLPSPFAPYPQLCALLEWIAANNNRPIPSVHRYITVAASLGLGEFF